MKKSFSIYILFVSFLCFWVTKANSQNYPIGTSLTTLPNAATITLPTPYNSGDNAWYSNAMQTVPRLNYSRTWVPLVPVTDEQQGFVLNGTDNYAVTTSYSNGWGQSLQVNKRSGSPRKDVVVANDLRPSLTQRSFLPFYSNKNTKFLAQPFIKQKEHYDYYYAGEQSTSYTVQKMDASQTAIEATAYAPGRAFIGNEAGMKAKVVMNDATEVPILSISGANLLSTGYYAANQLEIKTITGEHNATSKEYYDKDQKLICTKAYAGVDNSSNPIWLTTYNVYDKYGRLVVVVPPRGADYINGAYIGGHCFVTEYDNRNNVISSSKPGQFGKNYVVYDRKQRPVLVQSPKMDQASQWAFTIYDNQGRTMMTGILNSASDRTYWQNLINTATSTTSGTLLDYIVNEFQNNYPSTFTSITDCQIQTMNYYDDYTNSFFSGSSFDAGYTQYYQSGTAIIAPEPNNFTFGLLTGSKVAVLNSTTLNASVNTRYYYDRKGAVIQVQTQNPWNTATACDVSTYQYNFKGQKVLEISKHYAPNMTTNTKPSTLVQTSYTYLLNHGGELQKVEQKIDNSEWRSIASYMYDDMGRVIKKMMGGVETQDYDYDMRGALSAINGAYSQYGGSNQNKTFGCRLLKDHGFSIPRYDGKLSGYYWRGSGNMPERAYGYTYDPAGRMIHAEFRENSIAPYVSGIDINNNPIITNGQCWNKQHTDYTVSNLRYDKGGNILSMNQVGNPIMSTNPTYIDVLGYFYNSANKLSNVRDAIAEHYILDDFLDKGCSGDPNYVPLDPDPGPVILPPQESPDEASYFEMDPPPATPTEPEACADYTYDVNGNLLSDNNKGITQITYNQFNLPVNIHVNNPSLLTGGNIKHIYAANGALLQKTIVDTLTSTTTVYNYWGPFVYRNDSLLYILHQEGRARYRSDSSFFRYDYFVKDHQGNVRTVVTADPVNGLNYVAQYEISSANLESSFFFKINEVRGPNPESPSPDDVMSAGLDGAVDSLRIGSALLLHVMPGDEMEISAKSYWEEDTTADVYNVASVMLSALTNTLTGQQGGFTNNEAPDATLLDGLLSTGNYTDVYDVIKESMTDHNLPRAYLNYMVFDNRMQLIPAKSGAVQVHATAGSWQYIGPGSPLVAEQEGYILAYLSNEQHGWVKFDDFNVVFHRGRLIQEQHYYPYGLSIKAGEGSEEPNKYKFEGNSKLDELGLQLYDFHARQYDPQIGRFWSVDPLAGKQTAFSSYHFAANDPANFVDPDGLQVRGYQEMVAAWVQAHNDYNHWHAVAYGDFTFSLRDLSNPNGYGLVTGGGMGGVVDRSGKVDLMPGYKTSSIELAKAERKSDILHGLGMMTSAMSQIVATRIEQNMSTMKTSLSIVGAIMRQMVPDAFGISVNAAAAAPYPLSVVGGNIAISAGIIGNDFTVFVSGGEATGFEPGGLAIQFFSGEYSGKGQPSPDNYEGLGSQYNLGVDGYAASYSRGYSGSDKVWDTYSMGFNLKPSPATFSYQPVTWTHYFRFLTVTNK